MQTQRARVLLMVVALAGCQPEPPRPSPPTQQFTIPDEMFQAGTKPAPEPAATRANQLTNGWWAGKRHPIVKLPDGRQVTYDIALAVRIDGQRLVEMLVRVGEPKNYRPSGSRPLGADEINRRVLAASPRIRWGPDVILHFDAAKITQVEGRWIARGGRYVLDLEAPLGGSVAEFSEYDRDAVRIEKLRAGLAFYNPATRRLDPLEVELEMKEGQLVGKLVPLDPTTGQRRDQSLPTGAAAVKEGDLGSDLPKELKVAIERKPSAPLWKGWQDLLPEPR